MKVFLQRRESKLQGDCAVCSQNPESLTSQKVNVKLILNGFAWKKNGIERICSCMLCREQTAIRLGNKYTAPPSRDFLPEANTE